MNKAEQERTWRAFRKAFIQSNKHWEYNGQAFETRVEIYHSNVYISAFLESRANSVTARLHIGRAFREIVDVDGPQKIFCGAESMFSALEYLADCYLQTIGRIRDLEQEALKQIAPRIAPEAFEKIFNDIDQEFA